MPASILATKLHVPSVRDTLVPRPSLVARLNSGLSRKMSLVCAPAGYGKTTLVAQWARELNGARDEAPDVAWLSLDEGDTEPQRFLVHCVAALSGLHPDVGNDALGMLQTPKPGPAEAVVTSLINDLADASARAILVLDDYHLVESPEVNRIASFLLEHLPDTLHVVVSTRTDPGIPLARFRAGDEVTEIRAKDLRFSLPETAEFLRASMGLDLSASDVASLETRTEGWVAGLQLAALSLRGPEPAAGAIGSVSGTQRYVMDYLFEEVLARQPGKIQEFLMRTAILDRLSPELCRAVSGEETSAEILEWLDRGNLFVIPLDGVGYWHRYHHLFAELLQHRLERTHPELKLELHERAAAWWEKNGFVDQAIEHALRCNDSEWAASLLEANVEELWHRGEGMVIWRWLRSLPTEAVNSKPMLCIMHGYTRYGAGETEEAELSFARAEKLIASAGSEDLAGKLATVRALMNSFWGDAHATMRHADEARATVPESELIWRSHIALSIAEIHAFLSDTNAAEETGLRAIEAAERAGSAYFTMVATHRLLGTLLEQGRLPEALDMCREELRTAQSRGLAKVPVVGSWFLSLGEILNQQGHDEEALDNAVRGMALDRRNNYLAVRRSWSYFAFMRVLLSRSDFTGIEGIIEEMRTLVRESNAPQWVADQAAMWQARLFVAQGRVDTSTRWMEGRNLPIPDLPDELTLFQFQEYVVAARILVALDRLAEAIDLLARLHSFAQKNRLTARDIEVLALLALALQRHGDTEAAVTTISDSVSIAEPGGFIRVFVSEGPEMARLLYELASRDSSPYVRRLLAAFPIAETEEADRSRIDEANSDLFEPLTDRELDVLRLIAEGLTNQQIGERLFVSPHTVKTHTRNLFAKLDAHTRIAAVRKARGLGLIPT